MRKRLCCALVASLFILGGAGAARARDGEVTLYSINHLQSRLLPINSAGKQSLPVMGGLSLASGVVNADMKRNVNPVFVATGEVVAGTLWRYFKGKPEMTALARAGVMANTLGKHEFDYGLDHLKEALSYNQVPMVISNLVTQDPELRSALRKNIVLQAGNMKVGIFGLLSPAVMRLTNRPKEVTFDPDLEAVAQAMVTDLRRQGADVIVLLSGLYENESIALAQAVEGIHVITGCGSPIQETDKPILVRNPRGGTTALIWSGIWGQFVGRLNIRIKGGKLDSKRTAWKLLPALDRTTPDSGVLEVALEYDERLTQALGRVIGRFEHPIDARNKTLRTREAPIGNFVTDSFRWKAQTDVALMNSGGIRGNVIYPDGEFSERMLVDLLPFGDRIFKLTLTGKELRWVLEVSASALTADEGDNYDPQKRLHNGSFLQVSGIRVVYDLSAPPTLMENGRVLTLGSRLKSLLVLRDGKWEKVEDDKIYTVATTGWMVNGGDGEKYEVLQKAPRTETSYLDIDAFTEYLVVACEGRATPEEEGRIAFMKRNKE